MVIAELWNACSWIVLTDAGITISVNPVVLFSPSLEKASTSILSRPSFRNTPSVSGTPLKQYELTPDTVEGNEMLLRAVPLNAFLGISRIFSGKTTFVRLLAFLKAPSFNTAPAGITISLILPAPLNAEGSIDSIEGGKETDSTSDFENAKGPTDVTVKIIPSCSIELGTMTLSLE